MCIINLDTPLCTTGLQAGTCGNVEDLSYTSHDHTPKHILLDEDNCKEIQKFFTKFTCTEALLLEHTLTLLKILVPFVEALVLEGSH